MTVTTTGGLNSVIPLTNQAIPICQKAVATSKSFLAAGGPIATTLSFQPGAACTGVETIVATPHKYSYAVITDPTHGTLSEPQFQLSGLHTPTTGLHRPRQLHLFGDR